MKFGVREICEVVLRAKTNMKVGSKQFYKDEPVLYFDSLTTSSLEGGATTVYAQGGRGNARLLAWEGERTLTFNMTDALISPESFSVLSGASIFDAAQNPDADLGQVKMMVHGTSRAKVEKMTIGTGEHSVKRVIKLEGIQAVWNHAGEMNSDDAPTGFTVADYDAGADIFIMQVDGNEMSVPAIPYDKGVWYKEGDTYIECYAFPVGATVLVDYYTQQIKGKQIEITPDKFGGFFYLEASTLFRDEDTGKDLPAEFIIPRCKVQSNFTFSMAATGDPSTFDFVLDAFPDYTKFDTTKKVLAVLQVVEDAGTAAVEGERAHAAWVDSSGASTTDTSHKTRYGAKGSAVGYSVAADTIASGDFTTT